MKTDFETRLLRLEQWAWGGTPIDRSAIIDELEKIERALRNPTTENARYCQLYAAQQALSWAMGNYAAPPYDVIMTGKVLPLIKDTPAG